MKVQQEELFNILEEVGTFLPRLIEASNAVADSFYIPIQDDIWPKFGDVVEGMDDLYRTVNAIIGSPNLTKNMTILQSSLEAFVSDMGDRFSKMNQRMDAEMYVEAADQIIYELIPLFKKLQHQLSPYQNKLRLEQYNKNLNFIQERFPHVHRELLLVQDSESVEIFSAQDGTLNLLIDSAEEEEKVPFYSRYNPKREAKIWTEYTSAQLEGKRNVVLYGLGLGYHLEELSNRFESHQFIIYEPDVQVFRNTMCVIDLERLFSRDNVKDLAVGPKKNELDQLFYRFLRKVKGETIIISLPVYNRINRELKQKFADEARLAVLNFAYSKSAHGKFGIQWTQNRLYNMAVNIDSPSLIGLKGQMKNKPAVIVGAGPSLENDIEVLRELKGHIIIISAGSSIQSLLHYGIEPDLIVSMDGGNPNYRLFKNLNIDHIPFVYAPQVEYHIIENRRENIAHVYFANDLVTQVLMGVTHEDPVFGSSHSVTGTAIQAAAYLGCPHIAFTGQDLSYPNDSIYAPGSVHAPEGYYERVMSIATFEVRNVQGGINRTTEAMKLTLADIEEIVSRYPDVSFTNCSSLGAVINGAEYRPMSDFLGEWIKENGDADFFRKAFQAYLKPYGKERKSVAISKVNELPELLDRLDQQIALIRKQMVKLPEWSRTKPLRCLNAMVAIEENWELIVKSILFNTLFMAAIENEISNFDRRVSEIAEENDVIKKSNLFITVLGPLVDAIHERIPLFRDMFQQTILRIEARTSSVTAEV
ncbi:Uncharacterized conserved protein [Cohnella sp. OV330]|uniref:motility associated factor glycosyltransferase family protein n=1 Tax=Cohnella sp. OV330 TaxID=1855288 RepID=UPI0008F3923C|nr:6-hydroxymethylpterin diphosphokinase MptE-like protein [Cohnella sp. OV330]SFB47762.1 Uncharacterized conserved protein [Cohnella sp. OV330]